VKKLQDEIAIALAGRVAERVELDSVFLGSRSDIRRAVRIASQLITEHAVKGYKYVVKHNVGFHESSISESTMRESEEEIGRVLEESDAVAEQIIRERYDLFKVIVDKLIQKQFLSRDELLEIKNSVER
jgi:cell division protease FtsH